MLLLDRRVDKQHILNITQKVSKFFQLDPRVVLVRLKFMVSCIDEKHVCKLVLSLFLYDIILHLLRT
jgi:hypothetical protein